MMPVSQDPRSVGNTELLILKLYSIPKRKTTYIRNLYRTPLRKNMQNYCVVGLVFMIAVLLSIPCLLLVCLFIQIARLARMSSEESLSPAGHTCYHDPRGVSFTTHNLAGDSGLSSSYRP